jgi:putative phage-type endonuclease
MSSVHFVVVALEQGTDAWREWRHSGIGASEAPTVMGENPFRTAVDLFREKCGPVCELGPNTAMALGSQLEPEARRLYIAKTGKQVSPACLQSTRYDWLRASLDGLAVDYDGVVEIKCGKSAYQTTMQTGAVPYYNYGQSQHILAVTGFNSLDFWCYWPGCSPLLITVPRNNSYIERLLARELKFWNRVEQLKARLMQHQKSEWEVQREAPESRNQAATDEQKVRLKWFGCTWDEGITKGQASDAIEECIRLFPEKHQQYFTRPATEDQMKIMQELLKGCGYSRIVTEDGDALTYGQAEVAIRDLEITLQMELTVSEEEHLEDDWWLFNHHWGDLYRDVTRDEFANAWALALSRRKVISEGPTDAEVFAAMRELVIDFRGE